MLWTASRTDEEGYVSSSDDEEELRFGGKTFQRMALEWILLGNARTDPTIDNVVFYSSAAELLVVFVDAAVLAFRLLMYSSVGIVSSFVFWFSVTQDKYLNFLRANATAHEVINIPDDKQGPLFRAFLPHWDVVWAFYFPVASLMFLVPKKRQSALIVVLTIISSLIGHAISRFYASELIGELFPILIWPFNVLMVMGSRRGQLGFMFQQLMAFLIGLSVSLTRGWTHKFIPGSDSERRGSQVDTERIIELVRWFAIPLVGEMLTEYAAIITGSLLVIIFRQDLLRFPIEYYAGLEKPFDTDRDTIINDAASNAIWQVVAELVVDSICISIEKQRGFDLAWVFNHRHRYFALMFFAATWFGNVALGLIISAGGDRFANCAGENMCMCAADKNGGLDEFGLRQLYCDYFQDT
ncbi:Hypothetical Protein FCC1311_014692 [Hondaea fermentalgiana]|uniref:Uncharacterized protein n=1 Tax=Hondaea fermentalgiana TaxID=2315210 RepID=A0A2R5G2M7_9STRA|nr:Hypothetical Protein FCC1311_014692 [Hondaea fermentalgiana]|eukprot:GBG25252.1 Hypothetical Protein FCC1311_014692 [Hondaea fermentalgiana]